MSNGPIVRVLSGIHQDRVQEKAKRAVPWSAYSDCRAIEAKLNA
jgi:hypothetical protein